MIRLTVRFDTYTCSPRGHRRKAVVDPGSRHSFVRVITLEKWSTLPFDQEVKKALGMKRGELWARHTKRDPATQYMWQRGNLWKAAYIVDRVVSKGQPPARDS